MPAGEFTEERAEQAKRLQEFYRTRIDPTRGERIRRALRMMKAVQKDAYNDWDKYAYASKAAVYDAARDVLGRCGLHIRARQRDDIDVSEKVNAAGRDNRGGSGTPTIRLDAEFAVAAPLDGPDAPLAWTRKELFGPCTKVQSIQSLWSYARRYFIEDTLLVSTEPEDEIDHGDNGKFATGDMRRMTGRGGRRGARRGERGGRDAPPDDAPPPEDWPPGTDASEPAGDAEPKQPFTNEAALKRGQKSLGISDERMAQIERECGGDRRAVLRRLVDMAKKRNEEAAAAAKAGPALDPGAKLTPAEQREIANEAKEAGIGNAEAKVIVAAAFGAGRLADVTGEAASKAAAAEGLDLPEGASMRQVVGAVIRSHGRAGDAGAPPAGGDGAPPAGGDGVPPAGGDDVPPAGGSVPPGGGGVPPSGGDVPPAGGSVPPGGGAPPAGVPPAGGGSGRRPAGGAAGEPPGPAAGAAGPPAGGAAAPPTGGTPPGGRDDGAAEEAGTAATFWRMGDAALQTLADMNPERAAKLEAEAFTDPNDRLTAIDGAISEERERRRHRRAAAPRGPAAAPPAGGAAAAPPEPAPAAGPAPAAPAEPPAGGGAPPGDGGPAAAPPPLTLEEQIRFMRTQTGIDDDHYRMLERMAKGDGGRLLELLTNMAQSGS